MLTVLAQIQSQCRSPIDSFVLVTAFSAKLYPESKLQRHDIVVDAHRMHTAMTTTTATTLKILIMSPLRLPTDPSVGNVAHVVE